MKKVLLIAITTISFLGMNGFGLTTVQAQSLKEEIKGVKITKAYPNPARDIVSFDYVISREVTKAEVQFFNLIGEVVLRKELTTGTTHTQISINTFKKGVYFYRLLVNGKDQGGIQKLIVQ